MTLWDYERISRYWVLHPPVHLLVAGFMGYKAPMDPYTNTRAPIVPPSPSASIPGVQPLPMTVKPTVIDCEELPANVKEFLGMFPQGVIRG